MSLSISRIRKRLEQHKASQVGPSVQRVWASVAMILREVDPNRGLELMLIRRAKRKGDPWSGHMAFPGGRKEANDLDLLMTSIRETQEEVGMDLRSHSVHIGTLDDRTSPLREGHNSLVIRPYVFHAGSGNDWMCEPNEEVSEIFWFNLKALLDPQHRGSMPYEWQGQSIQLPIIRIGDADIWGLSLRMLDNFFDIVDVGGLC